uniref:Rab-GAP TBC domain-containing protein n=1 Tax=Timema tahoe TaxID=61484 RepID=A0A7R9IN50_9NEOP|nr:unnamed protein product [Timema tahoe]
MSVRLSAEDVMASSYPEQVTSQGVDNDDSGSETSSIVHNGSVISTVPDRHGFLGGTQYSTDPKQQTVPAIVVLRREQKWLRMLAHWDRVMNANYKKVRERCRKGIPPSVRPRAWLFLCGGKLLLEQSKTLYKELILQEGDARWVDDIRKDLHRQFPFHEMFVDQAGHGQRDLFQVLKAYSILNESVGYCQAQAPVAAFLLMHMPAEEAFWCLVSICDKTLPWDTILRVWDMFLCEGVKIVFKVALVLLKFSLGRAGVLKKCPTMYETLEVLRNPPQAIMEEEFLINQMHRLNLTEEDFEYEHRRQMAKRRAAQLENKKIIRR